MTLCVRGYRFGESNHAVYLIEALRRTDPSLLRNDWWTQSTLQYHFVFNALTAGLMRLGVLGPAFLAGYLALAVLLHVAWRKLTLRLGGSEGVYLLSVILYYILAGGVGLGMYHFLQDSAFLPSNVSNVAMLWGVYCLIAGFPASAGICLGVAGLFHINHALAGIGLWAGVALFERRRVMTRAWAIGTLALLALGAVQIIPALHVVISRSGKMPLAEFVDLFVRLRHPHHFDPAAWHWGVWLGFLAPLPLAAVAYQFGPPSEPRRRCATVFALFLAMQVFALLTAGFWFTSETLVQLNLYRFSIYPKLIACVAVAWLVWDRTATGWAWLVWTLSLVAAAGCFVLGGAVLLRLGQGGFLHARPNLAVGFLFAALAVTSLVIASPIPWRESRRYVAVLAVATAWVMVANRVVPLGVRLSGLAGDDPRYKELAAWVRDNTPADAVFVVPPDEESFRLHAKRAIVVNFKGVPQLSAELPEWRDRLLAVLNFRSTGELLAFPRPMGQTLRTIRSRYDALSPEHLFDVASRYGARYVILTRRADPTATLQTHLVHDSDGKYFLYDLTPEPRTLNPPPP